MFSLLAFLHRKVSSEENYSYSIFSATHLQIFCDIFVIYCIWPTSVFWCW